MKINVRYTEKASRDYFVATGKELSSQFGAVTVIAPESLSVEVRAGLVVIGSNTVQLDFVPKGDDSDLPFIVNHGLQQVRAQKDAEGQDQVRKLVQSTTRARQFIAGENTYCFHDAPSAFPLCSETTEYTEYIALYAHCRQILAEKEAKQAARAVAEKVRKLAEKGRAVRSKARWIARYGSERLKTAKRSGYNHNTLYVLERAAREHPGFTVDILNVSTWQDVENPSLEHMRAAKAEKAELVNLTHPVFVDKASHEDYHDYVVVNDDLSEDNPRAALVKRLFLDKYVLVKML